MVPAGSLIGHRAPVPARYATAPLRVVHVLVHAHVLVLVHAHVLDHALVLVHAHVLVLVLALVLVHVHAQVFADKTKGPTA